MKTLIREIEVLGNLVIAFRNGAQNAEDRLLTAGDAAFRLANFYYRNVRDAARNKVPEAPNVFEMLRLFWQRRRRMSSSEVPTPAVLRPNHAAGGSHEVIDNLR